MDIPVISLPKPLRFTQDDLNKANDEWGLNCGPAAIAAIYGLTPDEVRPHMQEFEQRGYTNPTMMYRILNGLPGQWTVRIRGNKPAEIDFPEHGLARIQWEGPWTAPGVHPAAAYRFTHWVGAAFGANGSRGVFDVNAGYWISFEDWRRQMVPWIIENLVDKRATGKWFITHAIEVHP